MIRRNERQVSLTRGARRPGPSLLAALLILPLLATAGLAESQDPKSQQPVRVPLPEARRMVRLMDDIYRVGVLTTHKMYVQEPGVPAAVTWGKQVIEQVKSRGWPEARIFDATDRPLNPENSPVDPFERESIQAFLKGRATVEKSEPGILRYATPIRAVDRSCLTCHVRARVGDLLGGVSYRVVLTPAEPTAPRVVLRGRRR